MLDNKTTKLLAQLVKICEGGGYKIIEKAELSKDNAELGNIIQYLQDTNNIDVKYSDDKVFCLTVLPNGRAEIENTRKKVNRAKIANKTLMVMAIVCFAAAFVGAFLGTILGGVFMGGVFK